MSSFFNISMKILFSVVTLYATLSNGAIVHGIQETDVKCVITSIDLLPKFEVSSLLNILFIRICENVYSNSFTLIQHKQYSCVLH